MHPAELLSFRGFEIERKHAASSDLKQLLLRDRFRLHGVTTLYVAETSRVPSLRGCAAVGFVPDQAHLSVRRPTRRRTDRLPVDDAMWERWRAATGR